MKKLQDDLYQTIHGFKAVKRDYVPNGKSQWYYLDPRGASTIGSMKQIDVVSENSPNPQLNSILAYDMQENPQEYYIWRTKGDNKVRGAHAEREGKIFNKHIPPVGGNPGEDYNCRCWAEPYNPEEYKNKPIVVDIGGLDIFKEIQPIDLNIKDLPQYAENNKANITTDGMYDTNYGYAHRKVQFRSPEEEKLLRHIAKIVVKYEKTEMHPYLDTVGKITVGNGMNVDNWNLFKIIHWLIDGRPATEKEIKKAYDQLVAKRIQLQKEYDELMEFKRLYPQKYAALPESQKKENGPFNYKAKYYKQTTNIRITEDEADYLMYSHLQDDYDTIKGFLNDFDLQPMEFKEAAFDIQYNTGNIRSFDKFKKAYDKRDIEEMARQSGRKIISNNRNEDIKNMILKTK